VSTIRIKRAFALDAVEKSVVQNKSFLYTIVSYSVTLAMFVNLNSLRSPFIGFIAFFIFFMINAVFLGNAFFEKETVFFRLVFGILLLIMILGFVGWLIMIIYNLDVIMLTLVLAISTTFSSLLNRRMKRKSAAH
jgi:hypothetical protein